MTDGAGLLWQAKLRLPHRASFGYQRRTIVKGIPVLLVLLGVVSLLIQLIIALVIVQFVVSLLFAFNVVSPHNDIAGAVYRACNMLLQPLLSPIQRIMPDTRPLDLSPMVLIFGLTILERVLAQLAYQGM